MVGVCVGSLDGAYVFAFFNLVGFTVLWFDVVGGISTILVGLIVSKTVGIDVGVIVDGNGVGSDDEGIGVGLEDGMMEGTYSTDVGKREGAGDLSAAMVFCTMSIVSAACVESPAPK